MDSLRLPVGPDEFAGGMVHYLDNLEGNHARNFILVPITLENGNTILAAIDTGAVYCIISAEEAEGLSIDFLYEDERHIGGGNYWGWYGRTVIGLEAETGFGISIESTIWVPNKGQPWPFPNMLGLSGFLERMRFAVDPEYNHFYFSSLAEDL